MPGVHKENIWTQAHRGECLVKKDRRREEGHVTKEGETGVSQEMLRLDSTPWNQEEAGEDCPLSFRGHVALRETRGPWL